MVMKGRYLAPFLATFGALGGGCAGILGLAEPDIVDGSVDGAVQHPGKDAAPDRTAPDTQAPGDATTAQDARDGAALTDSASDASPPGFCATYVPPADSSVVCDDFDEDPDAAALGMLGGRPGGALSVQTAVYKSSPRSLLVAVDPPDASASSIELTRSLGAGTTFTIACDTLIEGLGPPLGASHIVSLTFARTGVAASVTVYLNPALDGGVASWGVIEQDPVDGGYNYPSHPPVSVPASGWVHIVLSVTGTAGHFTDTLEVNGTVVDSNTKLASSFFDDEAAAQVGMTYAKVPGLRQVYFDNVVLIAQ
jgi:hypothetical protein